MKNMWKQTRKLLGLALMLAMVLSLTACGGGGDKTETYIANVQGAFAKAVVTEKDIVVVPREEEAYTGPYVENGDQGYTITLMDTDMTLTVMEGDTWFLADSLPMKKVEENRFEFIAINYGVILRGYLELEPESHTFTYGGDGEAVFFAGPFSYGDAQLYWTLGANSYGVVCRDGKVTNLYDGNLYCLYEAVKGDNNKIELTAGYGVVEGQLTKNSLIINDETWQKVDEDIYVDERNGRLFLLYDGKMFCFDIDDDDMEYYEMVHLNVSNDEFTLLLDGEEKFSVRKEKNKLYLLIGGEEIEFTRSED